MTEVVTIVLPGEPRGKGRPRFARATGHAYTPEPTRSYENALRIAAMSAMGSRAPLAGALEVGVMVFISTPRSWSGAKRSAAAKGIIRPVSRPDADNFLKIACDSCNGIVWRDDAQITDTQIRKRYAFRPSMQIFVLEIAIAELVQEAA